MRVSWEHMMWSFSGIRMAQEIVDAPTNEMHTDAFIEVMSTLRPSAVGGGVSDCLLHT